MSKKKLDLVAADDIARRLIALGYVPELKTAADAQRSVAKTVRTWIARGWPSGRGGEVKSPETLGHVSTGRKLPDGSTSAGTAVFDWPDVLKWAKETEKI